MKRFFILAAAASALLVSCGQQGQEKNPVIKTGPIISNERETVAMTKAGKVEGYLDDGIYTFKGIPYAKAERFMPPQDPDPWTDIRQCKIYGPKPRQNGSIQYDMRPKTDNNFGFQFTFEPQDEKGCLVLNVWTPGLNDGKKRPVFVWFHGGGYATGSGSDLPCYEGRSLAEKGDIVVVTVNHRLNILGYLDLTGVGGKYAESNNLGQKDLLKSLQWIHDNIAAFGGDPGMVTIGGQSGGGGKVSNMMATPSAKGLFHHAIVQSGSSLSTGDAEASRKLGLAVVKELGLTPATIDKINDFTYEELVAAGSRAQRALSAQGVRGSFGPVCDGKFITSNLFTPSAPECSKDVPMLIGTNLNESTYTNDIDIPADEVKSRLVARMGEDRAAEFMTEFDKVYPGKPAKSKIYTELGARSRALQQATIKNAQGGAKAYNYLFTWQSPVNDGALGACHGMELPFMFNNIHLQREMTGATPEAYILADKVSDAWIAFIKTGNPNTPSLPEWDAYDPEGGATMIFDNTCEVRHNHDKKLIEINTRQ